MFVLGYIIWRFYLKFLIIIIINVVIQLLLILLNFARTINFTKKMQRIEKNINKKKFG